MTDFPGQLSSSSYLVPPTCPVSVVELRLRLQRDVLYSEVCQRARRLAVSGPLRRVLGYSEEPALVSSDFLSSPTLLCWTPRRGHSWGLTV